MPSPGHITQFEFCEKVRRTLAALGVAILGTKLVPVAGNPDILERAYLLNDNGKRRAVVRAEVLQIAARKCDQIGGSA